MDSQICSSPKWPHFRMTLVNQLDFSQETYEQLVKLFTAPSDWVLNLSIASGECTFEIIIEIYSMHKLSSEILELFLSVCWFFFSGISEVSLTKELSSFDIAELIWSIFSEFGDFFCDIYEHFLCFLSWCAIFLWNFRAIFSDIVEHFVRVSTKMLYSLKFQLS